MYLRVPWDISAWYGVYAVRNSDLEVMYGTQLFEILPNLILRQGVRKIIIAIMLHSLRNIRIEVIQRGDPYSLEHLANILIGMREICKIRHAAYLFVNSS